MVAFCIVAISLFSQEYMILHSTTFRLCGCTHCEAFSQCKCREVSTPNRAFHRGHVVLPRIITRKREVTDRRLLGGSHAVAAGNFAVDGVGYPYDACVDHVGPGRVWPEVAQSPQT